mmetsp:Transcript_27973/g.57273  ORF Transcript_27973/g.57273 Transcript_27973/m.57273 type:complete len:85 (+) Transcript_27973:64-318(+)
MGKGKAANTLLQGQGQQGGKCVPPSADSIRYCEKNCPLPHLILDPILARLGNYIEWGVGSWGKARFNGEGDEAATFIRPNFVPP